MGQVALKVHGYNESTKADLEEFKNQITEIKKETSWKIPDLENLLKSRISESKAYALVKEVDSNLSAKMD